VSLLYSTIISFGLTILDLPRRPKYLGLLFYKTKISFWIDYFKPSEERPKYLVSLLYGTEISSTVDRIISKLRRPKYLWCSTDPIRFSFTSVTDGAFPRGNVACLASKFRSPGWDGSTETAQRTELSRGPRPVRFMPSSLFVASGYAEGGGEYDSELDAATRLAARSSALARPWRRPLRRRLAFHFCLLSCARCGPLGLSPAPIFSCSGGGPHVTVAATHRSQIYLALRFRTRRTCRWMGIPFDPAQSASSVIHMSSHSWHKSDVLNQIPGKDSRLPPFLTQWTAPIIQNYTAPTVFGV
jgi:hypothetical protein